MSYLLLVISWIAWCALHSILISLTVTRWLETRFPDGIRFHRLFFNIISVVTLIPLLLYGFSLEGDPIIAWNGPWVVVPVLLGTSALFFFVAGARRYDLRQVLGIRQISDETTCSVLTDDCSLDTSGVLSVVRHPWYTGGLLVVWARPLDLAGILTNLVICGYFLIGTILEERKLACLFGHQYKEYKQRVSMFFPIKWTKRVLFR